jgi:hypothetical protein
MNLLWLTHDDLTNDIGFRVFQQYVAATPCASATLGSDSASGISRDSLALNQYSNQLKR